MKPPSAGGGWPAIIYTFKQARASGGVIRMIRALSARNACKTCALGMGGQRGGMVNEAGRFPEVCKKSVQAMAADMQGRIREGFFDEFGFDKLSRFSPRELEHSGRLVEPLIAEPGDKSYRTISWEKAINCVADAMLEARRVKNRNTDGAAGTALSDPNGPPAFFYFSGRSSNEAAFLLQLVARLYGTNNINNCSYFCHQASGVGLRSVTGSGTASIVLDDVAGKDGADLLFVIGGNPASNHPRLMRTILDLRRRGGKVVVINPLKELGLVRFKVPSDPISMLSPRGSKIADEYLQPHIGGDLALFAGIAKALLQRHDHESTKNYADVGQNSGTAPSQQSASSISATDASFSSAPPSPRLLHIDHDYIANHTEGFAEFRAGIDAVSWSVIEHASGISRAEIERIAAMYAASKKTVFAWTMGITHHVHGVHNVRAIASVAMLRGMLGRPGAGLLPLRGHSNVQGIGSMGVEPKLKWEVLSAMQRRFGVQLPISPGLDTLGCIDAAAAGEIRFAWHLGGNLYGSSPDSAVASRALRTIDTTVFLSTTLNTGHIHGRGKTSIILPVLARDEESQSTTQESMFNYVRLSDGGRARYTGTHGPPLSEVEIICRIFKLVLDHEGRNAGLNLDEMMQHGNIRAAIADIVPGYAPLANIESPDHGEFQIPGRTFHTPKFKTESGRARFHPIPVQSMRTPGPQHLTLMTIRSEGQFNTVVYEEHDLYRGQNRRDVIMMNPSDITAMKLQEDELVTVRSDRGEMNDIRVRPFDIRAGNAAMYYPEANVLVSSAIDAESRTPAFKSVQVTIQKSNRLSVVS